MNRRDAIKGAATVGAGGLVAGCATVDRGAEPSASRATEPCTVQVPPSPAAILAAAPPLHLPRAYEIMEREKLEAIVVSDPVNAYYLTGLRPITSRMGLGSGLTAILTRDPSRPIGIVAAEFTYYYLLSDQRSSYPFEYFLYTDARRSEPFPDRGLVALTERERERSATVAAAKRRHPPSAAQDSALLEALRALGADHGRIAADDDSVGASCAKAGLETTVVSADLSLKRMRSVKSPREIALVRQAASANVAAALEATQTVRAGATLRELRTAFFAQAARRGNRGVFMVIDGVSDEGVDATVRDGQAFLIDAVSEGAGYHGDFARTVFVGEPSRAMKDVTAAIQLGWSEVRAALRPGMRFSEITTLGREVVRKAGYDIIIAFGPHSVGLYHQDAVGLGDLALEAGMVLSVDCPVLQSGVGGTAHLEDLMLITPDGAEPLHEVTEPIIQV